MQIDARIIVQDGCGEVLTRELGVEFYKDTTVAQTERRALAMFAEAFAQAKTWECAKHEKTA